MMALPHLKPTFYTQKYAYENNLVKKRNFEENYRQQWNDKAKYFKQSEINSNKNSAWSSEQSYNESINAYKQQISKDDNNILYLQKRRSNLAELFERERNGYQEELETELLNKNSSTSFYKIKAERLKSAREEERRKEANRLFYEHFKLNNPDLRKVEAEIVNKEVVDFWPQQIQEKAEKENLSKQEELNLEEIQSARQKLEEAEAEEQFRQKVLQERYLKDSLRRQIDEIKKKEEEAKYLKEQEAKLLQMQNEMEEYNTQRRLFNEARARQEYGRALLRQHTAVMRRKSQQIQEELESDIRYLSYLADRDNQENVIQTSRKEKAKADIMWMREAIEDQLRKEREREAELDSIFAEEAARLWSKREDEWAKEKLARDKLMQEVLNERKMQVEEKVMETRLKQAKSLREREQILKDIERDRSLIVREIESARQKKDEFRLVLDNQKSFKIKEKMAEDIRLRDELQSDRKDEQAYEEMLREEARRMRIAGVTPRSARR